MASRASTSSARNTGSPVSSMSLSNPTGATAPAPTPRPSNSRRAPAQDSPEQLNGVIQTGVVLTGDRPKSSGRGRVAQDVPAEFAANLAATIANGYILHVGDPNALNREVKGMADKWIKQNGGKAKVTVRYVTDKPRTAQLSKAELEALAKAGQDADKIVVTAYYAEKVEAA